MVYLCLLASPEMHKLKRVEEVKYKNDSETQMTQILGKAMKD